MSPSTEVTVAFVVLVLAVVFAFTFALRRLTDARWPLLVGAALGTWLMILGVVASTGFFRHFDSAPPRVAIAAMFALAGLTILGRSRPFSDALMRAPLSWTIALQSFRFGVELILFQLARAHVLPIQMSFEGRNPDVLVGLTAIPVAWLVHRQHLGEKAAIAWNLFSLISVFHIVIIALMSVPGPLFRFPEAVPNTLVADAPFVWLPGLLVPIAIFGHVCSLRRLLRSKNGRGAGGL